MSQFSTITEFNTYLSDKLRNVKLNEINDLTIKLKELNNEYEINEKRVITTNKYSIFAMSIIIIGLIIYVLKTNLVKKYS